MSRLRALLDRRLLPLAALVAAAALWALLGRGEPYREATTAEVAALLGRPGVHLLDANVREVYQAAHLPGAARVSWRALSADDLPADRHATLLFYCKNPH
jgi:hypothetical protein